MVVALISGMRQFYFPVEFSQLFPSYEAPAWSRSPQVLRVTSSCRAHLPYPRISRIIWTVNSSQLMMGDKLTCSFEEIPKVEAFLIGGRQHRGDHSSDRFRIEERAHELVGESETTWRREPSEAVKPCSMSSTRLL